MLQSLTILILLACTAFAQNISFFFPGGYDGVDPVASIESVNPTATIFRVACPSGTDSDNCGWGPGIDYTILSKTSYIASVSYASSTMSVGCNYNSQSTLMTCNAKLAGASISNSQISTILSGSDVSFIQASVVSGASLLSTTPTAMAMSMTTAAMTASRVATGPTATGAKSAAKTGAAARLGTEAYAMFGLVGVAAQVFL